MQSTILQYKVYRGNMKLSTINIAILVLLICFVVSYSNAETAIQSNSNKEKNSKDEIQRTYNYGQYGTDLQRNTVSNVQFYNTNYGIFGHNVSQSVGGLHWPRGSQNQYLYGGGIWFAAQKMSPDNSGMRNYVELSYNPNKGNSWFVPGRIEDGDTTIEDNEAYKKYRTYFSTDFRSTDGAAINSNEGPNWPLWHIKPVSEISTDYFGSYVNDVNQRNRNSYPQGPTFFSGEDIFCVFKDTDLSRYDDEITYGYPLHLQFEQSIYTWFSDDLKDIVLLKYIIINYSEDTLKNCWITPVLDPDIALSSNSSQGAMNDKIRYYNEEDSLNLAVVWSEHHNTNENGKGFGYLGVTLIETPAVDENSFLRKDKTYYPENSQLGLKTFRNWPIDEDINTDDERYNFISAGIKDGYSESPGDIRLVMASGPFNMLPGDTAKIVYALVLALPFVQYEADGTAADLADLVRKVKVIRNYYQNTVTGIEEESQRFTNGLSIKNIFPNPANDFCKIEYYLPKLENVSIEITNIYGMPVLGISNETVQNGLNSVEINTKSLSSGAYFVTLRTATEHISKLINIIK